VLAKFCEDREAKKGGEEGEEERVREGGWEVFL